MLLNHAVVFRCALEPANVFEAHGLKVVHRYLTDAARPVLRFRRRSRADGVRTRSLELSFQFGDAILQRPLPDAVHSFGEVTHRAGLKQSLHVSVSGSVQVFDRGEVGCHLLMHLLTRKLQRLVALLRRLVHRCQRFPGFLALLEGRGGQLVEQILDAIVGFPLGLFDQTGVLLLLPFAFALCTTF